MFLLVNDESKNNMSIATSTCKWYTMDDYAHMDKTNGGLPHKGPFQHDFLWDFSQFILNGANYSLCYISTSWSVWCLWIWNICKVLITIECWDRHGYDIVEGSDIHINQGLPQTFFNYRLTTELYNNIYISVSMFCVSLQDLMVCCIFTLMFPKQAAYYSRV